MTEDLSYTENAIFDGIFDGSYDEDGNLSLYIDRDGKQVSQSYNVFGSLVYEKAVDKNGENPVVTTYRYDSIGRLISYEYDKARQITRMTDPQGMTTRYEYDLLGRISRTYSDAGKEIQYHYDRLDRLEQIRYGNGAVTCYQYDGNVNRTRKQGEQWLGDISHPSEITYQYIVRGQLLEEQRSGKQEEVTSYHYDAAGNRVRKESSEGAIYYGYNEKNQLICEEGIRGRTVFTYSRQGSILSEEGPDGIRELAYNSKNQQVKVKCQNGQIQENRYGAEGLRHEMKENEKLLRFVYHRGQLLYEGGAEEKSYHLGYGIEAVRNGVTNSYYHRDEQLSTALTTAENSGVQVYYQYDAFGILLEAGEKSSMPIVTIIQSCIMILVDMQ